MRAFSIIVLMLAATLYSTVAQSQAFRPQNWEEYERDRYGRCYFEHQQRLANFEQRIQSVQDAIEEADEQFQWAVDPERHRIGVSRVELRHERARLVAQRPVALARSNAVLTKCKKAADLSAAKKAAAGAATSKKSYVTRQIGRTVGVGGRTTRTYTSPSSRSSGAGMSRGTTSRYWTPPRRTWGTGGRSIKSPWTRGTRCHHQPGTSQRHCGSG